MEALELAARRLQDAKEDLKQSEQELAALQRELDKKKKEFDAALTEKQKIEEETDYTRKRMEAANNLINSLNEEKQRWIKQSSEYADILRELTGNVLFASAFLTYFGPFNSEFRTKLRKVLYEECNKLKVPASQADLQLHKFLTDEGTIGEWLLQGLPTDTHSIENAIIATQSSKWPVFVDPQG